MLGVKVAESSNHDRPQGIIYTQRVSLYDTKNKYDVLCYKNHKLFVVLFGKVHLGSMFGWSCHVRTV